MPLNFLGVQYRPLSGTGYFDQIDWSRPQFVSEKYDGVRGIWTGSELVTKTGKAFTPPAWFLAGLPTHPIDGELWLGRNRFDDAVKLCKATPDNDLWKDVSYMVFDMPLFAGPFSHVYSEIPHVLVNPRHHRVNQLQLSSISTAQEAMEHVCRIGGEGIMIRQADIPAPRNGGSFDTLVKLKGRQSDEGIVVPGKTNSTVGVNWQGRIVNVRMPSTISGLSVETGTKLEFEYTGMTSSGLPKHPQFKGIRNYD